MEDRAMQKWAAALRGRRQWTEKQAREVLERQGASGDTVTAFARRAGFVPQRLWWWRERLQMGGGLEVKSAPVATRQFVPVVVRGAQQEAEGQAPMVVRIGEHVRVEVRQADATTAAWVAMLVASCGDGVSP